MIRKHKIIREKFYKRKYSFHFDQLLCETSVSMNVKIVSILFVSLIFLPMKYLSKKFIPPKLKVVPRVGKRYLKIYCESLYFLIFRRKLWFWRFHILPYKWLGGDNIWPRGLCGGMH